VINLTPDFAKRRVIENLWQNTTPVSSSRMQLNEIFNLRLITENAIILQNYTQSSPKIFLGKPMNMKILAGGSSTTKRRAT